MNNAQRQTFEQFFISAPHGVDIEAIWHEWHALPSQYDVKSRRPPVPVWARRSFSETGEVAWKNLQHDLNSKKSKGMCVYIHIPFCAEKCAFCDCYSFRLRSNSARQIDVYSAALEKEIEVWGNFGKLKTRPVSTVHFGGGTPLFIGAKAFTGIVKKIRAWLNVGSNVEWALETTSSALDESALGLLKQLGFSRIHVGIQSLSDPVRVLLKRRETAQQALEKIEQATDKGWVVSVDLIYGLPEQTLESLMEDVCILSQKGVDGFSLYPLQISSRNQEILQSYGTCGKNPLHEYFMLHAAEQVLYRLGFRKTLFNHYARRKDTNLYFTFPERDEDCLALGTIADGVFGGHHYRHLEYSDYIRGVNDCFPGLQGGMRVSQTEERLHPLEVLILSGRLHQEPFNATLGVSGAETLFRLWLDSGLIQPAQEEIYSLSASGSWFTGAMLNQLAHW